MPKLFASDFEGTWTINNATMKFWQDNKQRSTVNMQGGIVVLNKDGQFYYKKNMRPVDMSRSLSTEKIDQFLLDRKNGLKEPALLANTIIMALEGKNEVAIVSKSLYPEIIKRALELVFEKYIPKEKHHYLSKICIVCGYPENENNQTGKTQHIEAAKEFFKDITFSEVLLLDDDERNIEIHKKNNPSNLAVQANSRFGTHTSYSTVQLLMDQGEKPSKKLKTDDDSDDDGDDDNINNETKITEEDYKKLDMAQKTFKMMQKIHQKEQMQHSSAPVSMIRHSQVLPQQQKPEDDAQNTSQFTQKKEIEKNGF